jgi:acetoacetyl-CoA synthetase
VSFCEARTGRRFADHQAFHDFSVEEYRRFWSLFLDWAALSWDGSPEPVCTDDACERATFFPDLRLSYVDNLLTPGDDDAVALIARHADRPVERITRGDLRARVRSAAAGLRQLGLSEGDRVAAVAQNDPAAVVAALATAEVGASFSSADPVMGTPALLGRFGQLRPRILLAVTTGAASDVAELARRLPSLSAVVALDDGAPPAGLTLPFHRLSELTARAAAAAAAGPGRFPFNHPLFVLFTSGTTGPPKGIVHGAGGTLLEHVKEHRLHGDLGPADRLFFHTTAGWMMWNWQLSALASGSTIVLYDGALPGPETLWRLVAEERVTVFGTSPPYIGLCEESGFSPRAELDLRSLRAVLSTGSILHERQYDWVHEHVGPLPLQSISGGTDIIGCFLLGNPNLPVRRGWIQSRSLGLDVQALPTQAAPSGSRVGELVCRNPFPSRPLGFVGDDDATRFHATYFEQNPPAWTHGDLIEFDDLGQARMHGRSDGVVNVQGVRIGPAEIYSALQNVPEVRDAAAVELKASTPGGRSRLALLVVLREQGTLDGRLTVRIRREIAGFASAVHVPEVVLEVREIPVTHSGKRSERAAGDALNGLPATNVEALRNPGSLDEIRRGSAERVHDAARAEHRSWGRTENRLVAIWERVLGVAPLRPDDDFFDLGGTSLAAFELLQALNEEMGVDLPPSTLIHARTPAALAALVDDPEGRRVPTLVPLRPGGAPRPLFLVHSIWGDVFALRPLALALPTDRPVFGLRATGLDERERPQDRVEDMAATYLRALRSVQPAGPYAIAGYSFGGLVAFEMAQQVVDEGGEVEWLGLLDANVHHSALPPPQRWAYAASQPLRRLRVRLGVRTRIARYRRQGVAPWAPLARWVPEASPLLGRQRDASWAAFVAYRPRPFPGSATFVAATGRPADDVCEPLPAWRRLVRGELTVVTVPGSHADFIGGPYAAELGELLAAHLDARDREPAGVAG